MRLILPHAAKVPVAVRSRPPLDNSVHVFMKVVFAMSIRATDLDPPAPMIPGGYERNTLTHRNPGSMGADPRVAVPAGPGTMDAATNASRSLR